jgi:hypothetical protein
MPDRCWWARSGESIQVHCTSPQLTKTQAADWRMMSIPSFLWTFFVFLFKKQELTTFTLGVQFHSGLHYYIPGHTTHNDYWISWIKLNIGSPKKTKISSYFECQNY